MRERPILFSGPMIRAILAGTKTQTQRGTGLEYYSDPANDPDGWSCARVRDGHAFMVYKETPHEHAAKCPYGQPGDHLWVREAHYLTDDGICEYPVFAADDEAVRTHLADIDALPATFPTDVKARHRKLRPSIHMPRWASRITLEITGVRVERLQEINEADAQAEGIVSLPDGFGLADSTHYHCTDPRLSYLSLWEAINGEGSVMANPWVWAVEFRRIR